MAVSTGEIENIYVKLVMHHQAIQLWNKVMRMNLHQQTNENNQLADNNESAD